MKDPESPALQAPSGDVRRMCCSYQLNPPPTAVIRRSGAMEFPTRAQQYFDKIFNPKLRVQTGSSSWLKECMVPMIAKSVHGQFPRKVLGEPDQHTYL